MSLSDQLLAALGLYGLPILFGVIAVAAAGVPLPAAVMLVAAGSFVELGEMKLWQVIVMASAGAILGDQIGYALGRWGGRRLAARIGRRMRDGDAKIRRAESVITSWGGAGIFFTRWLVTPLGPWINLTSGVAGYSWRRFLVWDAFGEVLWVVLYVLLGKVFSDRVQALVELLGNLAWVIIGLIVAAILGWRLLRYIRPATTAGKDARVLANKSL
jgi:membrane protein DedA with SNARE-associated domain